MKKNKLRILAQEWFDKANEDLRLAQHLCKKKIFPSPICLHAHQAVEKYLKGFLVWHGHDIKDEFKTHNLKKLYQFACTLDARIDENEQVKESCLILNRYYIGARYPADMPEYPWEDVVEAVHAAEKVEEAVVKLIS